MDGCGVPPVVEGPDPRCVKLVPANGQVIHWELLSGRNRFRCDRFGFLFHTKVSQSVVLLALNLSNKGQSRSAVLVLTLISTKFLTSFDP